MKTGKTTRTAKTALRSKNVIRPAFVTLLILLMPLVAMQFSDEVVWGAMDFVVMGALLFGTGLGLEAIVLKTRNSKYRIALALALILAFLLIWVELAVGIFD